MFGILGARGSVGISDPHLLPFVLVSNGQKLCRFIDTFDMGHQAPMLVVAEGLLSMNLQRTGFH